MSGGDAWTAGQRALWEVWPGARKHFGAGELREADTLSVRLRRFGMETCAVPVYCKVVKSCLVWLAGLIESLLTAGSRSHAG